MKKPLLLASGPQQGTNPLDPPRTTADASSRTACPRPGVVEYVEKKFSSTILWRRTCRYPLEPQSAARPTSERAF